MTGRRQGFIFTALKGLGLIEREEPGPNDYRWENHYRCAICNDRKVLKKKFLPVHFANLHKDKYDLIARLLTIWGLVGEDIPTVELKENFTCSCGRNFNSNGGLFYHRQKTGHPTLKMMERKEAVPELIN